MSETLWRARVGYCGPDRTDEREVTVYVYAPDQPTAERRATANVEEEHPEATEVWLPADELPVPAGVTGSRSWRS